jgi:hypothetical protein
MADNDEAGVSGTRGEEPMEQNIMIPSFISAAVTNTLTSLFTTICESVRDWTEGGKKGPAPVISFGSRQYPILPPEDTPDTAEKKKKHRKRSKPAPKTKLSTPGYVRSDPMILPRAGDLSSRLHEAGQPILPSELLHLADGCMAPLQLAILKLEDNLLKDENPNYPVFTVKVPRDLVDFVDESPADLFFISCEDVFNLFHFKRLDYNLVRLYALSQAMMIRREQTPYVKVVDPYYMRDSQLEEGSPTRARATEYLQRIMLNMSTKTSLLLPFFFK